MKLSDDEKITYLANLVAVSRADGSVSPNEIHAVEEAQKRIGAKRTALRKAEALAQGEGFLPSVVGTFSARIANLEDMVSVSLADGVLDQAEKPVILAFARLVGITNEQFQLLVSEVRASFNDSDATRACPSCSAKVPRDAKFCPKCGSSLETTDRDAAVAVEYSIPISGIAVEFAESTASGFIDAVRKAKTAPENAESVKGGKTWYMAAWPKNQIAEAAKLVEDLKGMRNRKVWVDGKESRWDEVFGFTWCNDQRGSAYRPLEYCFGVDEKRLNIWGCKNARMDWSGWAEWFSYGNFKKNGFLKAGHIFVFDKKRIRHELETNLYRVRFCPHLNFRLIDAVLVNLPDEVEATVKGDWTYKRDYEESPGSIRVKEKIVGNGYTHTDEYYASGVTPRTPAIGLAILKKAFDATDVDASVLKGVLSYRGE
ncbi:zinc-ribbon domain-containing protein [Denitromonas halophila]|uniref:Zinc-ribbon domain-containing protein n=1 Tax=Denitromonas halophila TaxID=1629404 RepID=A0A557R1I3_9RHOO|nr:zinc-ribbon domain-containing protein [Denitromonas halophila]TVO59027.1 zinc-ribbon domain-containing protein [Denitromonas halophila]